MDPAVVAVAVAEEGVLAVEAVVAAAVPVDEIVATVVVTAVVTVA